MEYEDRIKTTFRKHSTPYFWSVSCSGTLWFAPNTTSFSSKHAADVYQTLVLVICGYPEGDGPVMTVFILSVSFINLNPFPGGIYYDCGGWALWQKRPTSMAHWRCRPVRQNVERETGGSTNIKKNTIRALHTWWFHGEGQLLYLKNCLKQIRLSRRFMRLYYF
jgi:hypothetical protein